MDEALSEVRDGSPGPRQGGTPGHWAGTWAQGGLQKRHVVTREVGVGGSSCSPAPVPNRPDGLTAHRKVTRVLPGLHVDQPCLEPGLRHSLAPASSHPPGSEFAWSLFS